MDKILILILFRLLLCATNQMEKMRRPDVHTMACAVATTATTTTICKLSTCLIPKSLRVLAPDR
uniref:Secreted protein n=1 Tax=Romanomermis culicivorax TaxID=13658 RepID=A0A915IXB3_ROMCU